LGQRPRMPPRHRAGEAFLRGPVPVAWLAKACLAGHCATRVALALWFRAGVTRRREVSPSHATWQVFGLSRQAGHRGLRSLEAAGLVTVDRRRGRCPVVTLLDLGDRP